MNCNYLVTLLMSSRWMLDVGCFFMGAFLLLLQILRQILHQGFGS